MKRVLWFLGIVSVVALVLSVAAVVGAEAVWQRAGREPWPVSMGTFDEIPARHPKHGPSAEALRLAELARPLGIDFENRNAKATATENAIRDFVDAERARGVVAIEAPPADIAQFLTEHAEAIDALGAHLRASRDIAWPVDLDAGWTAPIPNLSAYLKVARVLSARALVRARSGDPGAWEDLHAVSMLDRSLHGRAELIPQVLGLSIARMLNAVAWKLPVPAPAWLSEDRAIDRRRLLLQGMQADSWAFWRHAPGESKPFPKAYVRASVANLVLHQRASALEISRVTACSFDGSAYGDELVERLPRWNTLARVAMVNIPWAGVLRFEAEREATANALRVRAGQPAIESSRCSDGQWHSENGQISFTREIPGKEKDMPLRLNL
ncbi:MAG TPA: hypothetical protein VFP80_18965 [Thermoanaerobaculia bacterium]|nr:hypothetical protein [Thermoanaerobaculia bacterium]